MSTDLLAQLAAVVGAPDIPDTSVPYELPTSLPNVNLAVSGRRDGGFPGGRLITIAGPESSGKTALATELLVQAQKLGGFGLLEDFEHAWHHGHAKALGTDYSRFYPKKPAHAEEGFQQVYEMLRTIRAFDLGISLPKNDAKNPTAAGDALRKALRGKDLSKLRPIVAIMDSIASMIPRAQDIEYSKQNMKTKNMEHAMMLSIELKRLARDCDDTGTTAILLNQLRTNPGILFGDNSTEPGGNSPRFYASVMLRLRRVGKWHATYDDKKSEVIGDIVELFTRKNKVFRPFKKTQYVFRTLDPVGLDVIGTMIHLGKAGGVLGSVTGEKLEFKKKKYTVMDFDALCRADDGLKNEFVEFVMSEVDPVADGPVIDDDDEKSAFAGLDPASIPLVAPAAAA